MTRKTDTQESPSAISAKELELAYRKAFVVTPDNWLQRIFASVGIFQSPFFFADRHYLTMVQSELFRVLQEDETNLEKYVAEDFDCDDFAFRLMGIFHTHRSTARMPIFITWLTYPKHTPHAVLSYFFNGCIYIIEPQTDEVSFVPAGTKLNLLTG